jgi:glycosyltransferase involved in cell wall biosynthesis
MLVSVIVAVYKDLIALRCIIYGLEQQTVSGFEVIVAEDGNSAEIEGFLSVYNSKKFSIVHMTQEDSGFRKTRAVNRAIAKSRGEYLIFIDGDCIPHNKFIENHLKKSGKGFFCAGRKMHLGMKWSDSVRHRPSELAKIQTWANLFKNIFDLHKDHVRNFEIGAPSRILDVLFGNRRLGLIGCNFSIHKSDIMLVNGYDEELTGIGGEDDDLGMRLEVLNVKNRNVKFQAICYHLYHESRRMDWGLNKKISAEKYKMAEHFAKKGVSEHINEVRLNNE